MTKLCLIEELPEEERNVIREHASRIPNSWNVKTLPRIRIPTYRSHVELYKNPPDFSKPNEIEYVEFEVLPISRTDSLKGWALIANGSIIVDFTPHHKK